MRGLLSRTTTILGSPLDPALGAGDRRGDTLTLSVDEGAVAVDALPVALEVVEAGEAALARR